MNKLKVLERKDEINEIIEKLYVLGSVKKEDYWKFMEYKEDLEYWVNQREPLIKIGKADPNKVNPFIDKIAKELERINEVQWYRSSHISILKLSTMVRGMYEELYLVGKDDDFYTMKEFVEGINSYYEIKEPYKPSNKIAFGWNFALQKGSKAFRPYLLGCVRNYLNKNNVEWEMKDLQKICNLRDCENGDE